MTTFRDGLGGFTDCDAASTNPPPLNLPQRYHLLSIAIDKYRYDQDLENAVNEAEKLKKVLSRHYGFDHCYSLYNERATRENIRKALEFYAAKLSSNDALLIHYAGHGKANNLGNTAFKVYDSVPSDPDTWREHAGFIQELRAIEARYILLLIDSCYAGGIAPMGGGAFANAPNTNYVRNIAERTSRIALTSGGLEPVPDLSRFAKKIIGCLRDNQSPWLLSGNLFTAAQNIAVGSTPAIYHLPDNDHGAEFIFHRRDAVNSSAGMEPLGEKPYSYFAGDSAGAQSEKSQFTNPNFNSDTANQTSSQQPRRYVSKNPDLQAIVDNDVLIHGGSFLMGSPKDEQGRYDHKGPQRQVQVPSFYLGRYPVTRSEYARFAHAMGSSINDKWRDPGFKQGDDHPVVRVSWNDAQTYIEWLNLETGLAYRLPSEAEWEYACRASTSTRFWWGNDARLARLCANFSGNHGGTTAVGSFKPNPWGLYDMSGNVWEWVQDCWNNSYQGPRSDGLAWLKGDCSRRVLRGGSWNYFPDYLRSASRSYITTGNRYYNVGFRVSRTLA